MSTKSNESKQRILLTALDLIKEKGYNSVTIKDICTAANISKPTFYYYFKSKEDLLIQFYSIPTDTVNRNLTSILMEEHNIEQYWKLMEPVMDFMVDNGTDIIKNIMYALVNQNIQAFSLLKFQQDIVDVGTTIIGRAQASGEIRNTSDPFLLINVAQTQFIGVVSRWCTTDGNFDLKNAFRLTIEVCFDVKPELRKASSDVFTEI